MRTFAEQAEMNRQFEELKSELASIGAPLPADSSPASWIRDLLISMKTIKSMKRLQAKRRRQNGPNADLIDADDPFDDANSPLHFSLNDDDDPIELLSQEDAAELVNEQARRQPKQFR